MRAGVRRTRVGCAFHRWYTPGTGRYTRTDPINLGRLLNLTSLTNLDPFTEYMVANRRVGYPKFESGYGYGVGNPLTYVDPDGQVLPALCLVPPAVVALGKAAAATLAILATAAAGEAAYDWLSDQGKTCDDCDDEPPGICEELLRNDQDTCGFWAERGDMRNYQACMGAAMDRYSECLRGIFPPRIPLQPSPFGQN